MASVPAQAESSYTWTISGGTLTGGQGSHEITFTADTNGQVTLAVVVANAASTRAMGIRSLGIVPAPLATVTAPTGPVTSGRTGLTASVPLQAGVTYAWTVSNGTIASGEGTSEIVFTAGSPGELRVDCTVTNLAGDQATGSWTLPVVAAPNVNISVASTLLAEKEGITASVPHQPGATYEWRVTGATLTSGADTNLITFSTGAAGTVTLEVLVTNAAGDSAAGERNVEVVWGYFTGTGSMNDARKFAKAVTLTNGRVLVTGGRGQNYFTLRSAEVYNPVSGTFSRIGAMQVARASHTATLLADGRVLVAGGFEHESGSSFRELASAEIYNPANGTWTPTGSMSTARYDHTATLLQDGRVLVAGGSSPGGITNSAEIWDPATGTWTPTASMPVERQQHVAMLLDDGRVLVTGGNRIGGYRLGAPLSWNPETGIWTSAGSTVANHDNATAVRLADGTFLISGGLSERVTDSTASEIYDPVTGTFRATGDLIAARAAHDAALLANGRVLLVGGYQNRRSPTNPNSIYTLGLASAELFDPATDSYLPTRNMSMQRAFAASAVLPDGRVLVMGGEQTIVGYEIRYTTTATAEIFNY